MYQFVAVLSVWGGGRRWLHDQSTALVGTLFLAFALGSGATALDTASFGALEVVRRNPGFIVALGPSGDSGRGVDLNRFGLLDRSGALRFLLLELREVGDDPNVVEGIANTDGASEKEYVEKDPVRIN